MGTFETVRDMLVEKLNVDPSLIKPEAELASDLEINSLELAEFILTCEERFNITINDDQIKSLVHVSDIIAFLDKTK